MCGKPCFSSDKQKKKCARTIVTHSTFNDFCINFSWGAGIQSEVMNWTCFSYLLTVSFSIVSISIGYTMFGPNKNHLIPLVSLFLTFIMNNLQRNRQCRPNSHRYTTKMQETIASLKEKGCLYQHYDEWRPCIEKMHEISHTTTEFTMQTFYIVQFPQIELHWNSNVASQKYHQTMTIFSQRR